MTKKKTKTETRKKNFIIYSLNGGMFNAEDALNKPEGIAEEDILSEVFKRNSIDDISFTKITKESFSDLPDLEEDIRIYFSSSKDEVWNYNPIMSAYMGDLVYSSILVFVSENELEENFGNKTMPYDQFLNIVSGFVQICTQYVYQSLEDQSQEEKKKEPKKSPMFGLSKISFKTSVFDNNDGGSIRPGKDKHRLDEYWKQNYIGKYHPDFVFNDLLSIDEDTGDYSKSYILMKPGVMTLYLMDSGKVEVYLTQYNLEIFTKIVDEMSELIEDLGKDPKEEEIKKEKEKAMAILYS